MRHPLRHESHRRQVEDSHSLASDPLRHSPLQRAEAPLGGVTNTVLARNLKELEADGLIIRKSKGTVPPSVTYELSDEGKKLIEPLDGLYRWGEEHRRHREMPTP